MTDASQLPKLPWWVRWWADNQTTRISLRRDARFDFLAAVGFLVGFSLLAFYWDSRLSWGVALAAMGFAGAGIWKVVAMAWIDRHQAWDRVATQKVAPSGSTEGPTKSSSE
jgi:hypothetical protein